MSVVTTEGGWRYHDTCFSWAVTYGSRLMTGGDGFGPRVAIHTAKAGAPGIGSGLDCWLVKCDSLEEARALHEEISKRILAGANEVLA